MRLRKGAKNIIDEETLCDFEMRQPIERPDAAPRSDNPIRRFREELRLTNTDFAKLCKVPFDTARSWERPGDRAFKPNHKNMTRLISLARRNHYPLMMADIQDWFDSEE